jgi:hypothetical protein
METQQRMPVELHVTDRHNIKIASFAPKNFMAYLWCLPEYKEPFMMYLWRLPEYKEPRPSRKVPDIFVSV